MDPLHGKVVLVTGASRGLGIDIARAFAKEGARIGLAARSEDELRRVKSELCAEGADAHAFTCDVAERRSLEGLMDDVGAALGPIDVLVNNAGVEEVCDFESMRLEDIERIFRVNLLGLSWLTRIVAPAMIARKSGHICNIASMAGLMPVPHNAVYSASKHAVVGLTRSLRLELADHGVEVSVVCPGFVTGGMFLQWGRQPPAAAGVVTPDEVATATVRTVKKNLGEVNVTKGIGKIGDWFQAAMPELSGRLMDLTGVLKFMREQARLNAERGHGLSS